MILDTSAVIALLRDEPEAPGLAAAIQDADRVAISAATLVEASLVCGASRQRDLDDLLARAGAIVEPVDADQAALARGARLRFGRGSGSPARLNYGDCFSNALAQHRGEPLLFIGEDFPHTDVVAALPAHPTKMQNGCPAGSANT